MTAEEREMFKGIYEKLEVVVSSINTLITKHEVLETNLSNVKDKGCDPIESLEDLVHKSNRRVHQRLDNLKLLASVITAVAAAVVLVLRLT